MSEPHIDRSELPEDLRPGNESGFDLSDAQILVDRETIVAGYSGQGADTDHMDNITATVFAKVEGRLNNSPDRMDVTLILNPEVAANLARSLLHSLSHFPDEHLGFKVEDIFGESENEYHEDHEEHSPNSHWTNHPTTAN